MRDVNTFLMTTDLTVILLAAWTNVVALRLYEFMSEDWPARELQWRRLNQ